MLLTEGKSFSQASPFFSKLTFFQLPKTHTHKQRRSYDGFMAYLEEKGVDGTTIVLKGRGRGGKEICRGDIQKI